MNIGDKLKEAAYQYELAVLDNANIDKEREYDDYRTGLKDAILEVASKAFIAGAEWVDESESWIDIKDMKPEDILIDANTWVFTEKVLVLTSDGDIDITNRFWDNKHEKWRWNVSPYIGDRITHWMPLPKKL